MINELIEKEIPEQIDYEITLGELRKCLKNIAKEVAMRFKKDVNLTQDYYDIGYGDRNEEVNNLADQIINEVSK